jgi:hypothetical protein
MQERKNRQSILSMMKTIILAIFFGFVTIIKNLTMTLMEEENEPCDKTNK